MKKKKIIIYIILLVISSILIAIGILLPQNNDKPKNKKTYSSLIELANEMYNDGSYKKLPKDTKKNVYYMTLGEYKRMGYNVDIVDSTCQDDFKMIYFNIDGNDDFNPFYIVKSCNEGKNNDSNYSPETSLLEIANNLYESNEYLKLAKGDGGYYMTIGMYKNMGYDPSLINPSCPDDSGVIFFDIDNKDNYETNPVFVVYECN